MDIEDKRVGDVAEGILYEFLPSAFNSIIPPCGDPRTELTHERCKLVASAALSVGALMNAPPPFLEFLLRIPWQKIEELHRNASNLEWIQQQLEIPEHLRKELVNTPIHPSLMPTVLEFLFSEGFLNSLPPQLKATSDPPTQSHLDHVAALLDGAGPLHCAAIRGNPAQVDHLLYCGADVSLKTHPGDLPLQLVPFCAEKNAHTGARICRCMHLKDQEIWECRSATARSLIVKRSLMQIGYGVMAWLTLLILCLLNAMGLWGCHGELIRRPVIHKHVEHQKEVKSTKAYLEAKRLLSEMRKEARQGQQFLAAARQLPWNGATELTISHDTRASEDSDTQKAFLSYVHAVHFLQNLLMHNDGKDFNATPETAPPSLPKVTAPDCQVAEEEQAELYCCWAESVLLKFKSCRCDGCAAVAVSAIRMAHIRCAQLLSQLEKQSSTNWKCIGAYLMQVVYLHICLLLDTEAAQSATKASMWRSEQCVKEWKRLREKGIQFSGSDASQVEHLEQWVITAESDLTLAEALYGDLLSPSQTVKEILNLTVTRSPAGMPCLLRSTSLEHVNCLEAALSKARAPSSDLAALTVEVTQNGKREIRAAAKLKEYLASKGTPVVAGMIEKLSEAIMEAEPFPRLTVDVSTAKELHQQLLSRAEAIERLEVIMLQAKQPLMTHSDAESPKVEASVIEDRISALQTGIEQGKKARINTEKARKLLRELQAHMSAVEAAHQLDAVMTKKPCGSAALKTALSKAEGCYSSATGHSARKRLELERVVESLNRATATCTTVNDLSKLESIILDARKVFDQLDAEEADQRAYHAARTLRGTLHSASKIRQQLHASVTALHKHQRKVDSMQLEETIESAEPYRHLLEDDVMKSQQALDHWKCIQKMEEHLQDVIQNAVASTEVSKAVQEASGTGVKTQFAKKVLKLMQNVENAMQQLSVSASKCGHLRTTIEEAEKGGVSPQFIAEARSHLNNTQAIHAQEVLNAALDQGSVDLERRCEMLNEALERAGGLMEVNISARWQNRGDTDERVGTHMDTTREVQSLWEAVERVRTEIRGCEDEMLRLKLTAAEQAKRERDQKLEKQRQEQEKQAELERKQREQEAAIEKEEQLKREQREKMKKVLQLSLEKQEKEKKVGLGRKLLLVDPTTQLPMTEPPAIASPAPSGSGSMDTMEYQVNRLLEDDSPVPFMEQRVQRRASFPPPESHLTAKGVLENLDDPWDVQSSGDELRPALLPRQDSSLMPRLSGGLDREASFRSAFPNTLEALFAKSRVSEGTVTPDYRFGSSQPLPSWSNPVAMPILSRRYGALDSSAPAFYPSAAPDVLDYGKGPNVFSTPLSPPPLLSLSGSAGRRLEVPILSQSGEVPRPAVRPFPGVGAGIPGTPSRSLSERLDRLKQMSLTLSEKEKFSMSGEL